MRLPLILVALLLAGCVGAPSVSDSPAAPEGRASGSTACDGCLAAPGDALASGDVGKAGASEASLESRATRLSAEGDAAASSAPLGHGGCDGAPPGQQCRTVASLTAGDVDDHLNWERYLRYLQRVADGQQRSDLPPLDLDDRVTLRLVDAAGRPLPLVPVTVRADGQQQQQLGGSVSLVSGSDGVVRLFPRADGLGAPTRLLVSSGGETARVDVPASREATVALDVRNPGLPRALDLMFVIDTTGSMGDELDYITRELGAIVAGVAASQQGVDIRVGLTVYRDEGDAYVVKRFGFATDVSRGEQWIAAQRADGGGDYPEAMDQALAQAVDEEWRGGATSRILFLVADAPPHAEGYHAFVEAAHAAREKGIRIYPLAASGVADEAEYLMRAAAVLTQARYLFLTDDSGIGLAHAEPSIPCYQVAPLKDLIVRVVRSELSGERVEAAAGEVVRTVGEQERGVCVA